MIKRIFDIVFSFTGIIILLPLFLLLSILIKLNSKGPIFFTQTRVGKNNNDFKIYKFRTMFIGADKDGLLTIGNNDARVTKIGYYLRKYKLDELPQLINVLNGTMSFVGPRPEVREYVNYYSKEDLEVFNVKPGITDYASIVFRNEAELLKKAKDPEKMYLNEILKKKIALNKKYINNSTIITDIKLIFKTLQRIIKE
ncbi:sugar transferase [Mangrovimonas spongiae]|uniref:Sugar transferase n=1 Tax=Mangrovimonas spongiae TaxID=2494697 RepID=A0A3R9NVS4_9FLAO|nr:sugar transferase [Mangrovimonas spongiae]RSK38705.1 sugar transferase [Mangrovimonas spongiae]